LHNSFETLQRFTSDASHELRTPLTALRSVGEVALREGENATALRDTIGSMLEEAQRLTDLIDSLLLLARVENGRLPPHLEPFSFPKLLEQVRESVDVLAAEKQQKIILDEKADLMVTADPLLTRQATMNILDNAIRYSPPGTNIFMRCFHRDGSVIAEIADEGPGIAPEHQQRIFERFFRIDKARSRDDGGAGLGLAISKLSIERQGGRIELESAIGKGSRFRIILPGG
jgi:signal transduction histidine kinase